MNDKRKADPEVVRRVTEGMQSHQTVDPRAWAYRLRDREQRGEKLSPVQRRFWREALKVEA